MVKKWTFHICHPRSGDCAMGGIRFNIGMPWCFIMIGLFGGQMVVDRNGKAKWLIIDRDWPRKRDLG